MDELITKRTYITRVSTDKDLYHTAQVSYLGQTADVEVITPYGVYSNLPLNSQLLTWNVNGVEENRVSIGNTPRFRFKNLKPGEVVLGSPQTRSRIFFSEDGSIVITQHKGEAGKQSATDKDATDGKSSITIDPDGNIKIVTKGTHEVTTDGDVKFTVGGTFEVVAGDIILNGEHEPDN
jgi:hypothetical protein